MPRTKKYKTAKAFEKACMKYFSSITRIVAVTVQSRNELPQKVKSCDGEYATRVEYIVPPTISGLCIYLGISRQTWSEYSDYDKNPEYAEVTEYVRLLIESWLEEQLCTRKKGVQGIIFNLQNNYDWKEKKEVELGAETRKGAAALTLSEKQALLGEIKDMVKADLGEFDYGEELEES